MAARSAVVRKAERGDLDKIVGLDLSYSTDRIYSVRRNDMAFWLEEHRVDPPLEKTYPRPQLELGSGLLVACTHGEIIGYGELQYESWNDRARIEHIYVSRPFRGRGVGRSLLDALTVHAHRIPSARCLWLETQNVNYPAVQFYLRMGFRLCGLDETLYHPADPYLVADEVALYFARDLQGHASAWQLAPSCDDAAACIADLAGPE
jgi:ribosomal protein S18 acetylase RimI-like enzyme